MFMRHSKKDLNVSEPKHFRFPPLFGGRLLAWIYVPLLSLFVFLFLLWFFWTVFLQDPQGKAYLEVDSSLSGSVVYWDDHFIGYTPLKTWVKQGSYKLRVERYGYQPWENILLLEKTTIFSNPKARVSVELQNANETLIWKKYSQELGMWSAQAPLNPLMPAPDIFGQLAEESQHLLLEFDDFSRQHLAFINDPLIFEDFWSAWTRVHDNKNTPDLWTRWQSLQRHYKLREEALLWFLAAGDPLGKSLEVPEIKKALEELDTVQTEKPPIQKRSDHLPLLPEELKDYFFPVDGGILKETVSLPPTWPENLSNYLLEYPILPFYIKNRPVTKAEFMLFLRENPDWSLENKDQLIQKRKVSEDYLDLWNETALQESLSGVSALAATAYATWFSSKLPQGIYAVLPTKTQWRWVQHSKISFMHPSQRHHSIHNALWTSNPYAPLSLLLSDDKMPQGLGSLLIPAIQTILPIEEHVRSQEAAFPSHWASPQIYLYLALISD